MIKSLIRWKIYADRARWYMAFGQTVLQLAIYFSLSGGSLSLYQWVLISLSTVVGFVVVGFIDVKVFKALKEEQRNYSEQNPVIMEILDKQKEILDKLNKGV